jgi:hypothetical protein
MGTSYRRMFAAAVLVVAMSALVGLVVVSPLIWRDEQTPGPRPVALPQSGEVPPAIAPALAPETAATPEARAGQVRPLPIASQPARAGSIRPLQRPAQKPQPVVETPQLVVETKGKAKGHEKQALGSKKAGKHGHHAQGAPGKGHAKDHAKGHGKGKSKDRDRDRAPARARG